MPALWVLEKLGFFKSEDRCSELGAEKEERAPTPPTAAVWAQTKRKAWRPRQQCWRRFEKTVWARPGGKRAAGVAQTLRDRAPDLPGAVRGQNPAVSAGASRATETGMLEGALYEEMGVFNLSEPPPTGYTTSDTT